MGFASVVMHGVRLATFSIWDIEFYLKNSTLDYTHLTAYVLTLPITVAVAGLFIKFFYLCEILLINNEGNISVFSKDK